MSPKKNRKPAEILDRLRQKLPAILVTGVVVGGVAAVVWNAVAPRDASFKVAVPELSAAAIAGKAAFDATCATCHGQNAAGTDKGPPLVHDIYNPGHHGDAAFFLAAKRGVPRHHWPFGNMPAQPNVTDEDIAAIVRYVRELQIANGITYRQHTM